MAGFVGQNGAGRSTTIRMLIGLNTPTSGGGEVLGHPISRPNAYLHRVGRWIGPLGRWTKAGVRSLFTRQTLRPLLRRESQRDLVALKEPIEDGVVVVTV